jgi:dynein intermediate chain 1, axonemal
LICLYSLKNPSFPEYQISTESGVMCLHFHPEFSNLLVVGCYDGTVSVYDVRTHSNDPIYSASVRTGKHNEPVWQAFWQVSFTAPGLGHLAGITHSKGHLTGITHST